MTSVAPKYQIMPDMSPEEFALLKEDIRHKGMLVPIEYDVDNNIIDGHHRYRAFEELINEGADIPMFDSIVRRFDSEQAKIDYVVSLNVKRRHLSPEQRAELVVKLRKPPFAYTLSKIAVLLGVNVGTISRDIDSLPPAEREELKALTTIGADGRTYTANYAPRIFSTGQKSLKDMQRTVISGISTSIKTQGYTYTPEQTAAIQAEQAAALATINQPPAPTSPSVTLPRDTPPDHTGANALESAATVQEPPKHTYTDDEVRNRLSAFAWYGGKSSHLSWLLPLLPPSKHFVDLYGGSAAVLLNKQPSPIETYNDLDNNVVNFFRVLREQPEELMRLLHMTPYSRQERREAYLKIDLERADLTDLEKARLFFTLARQTRSGIVQRSNNMLNSWRFTRDIINRGLPAYVSQWQAGIDGLAAVAARLRNVQIENYPALRILDLYDTPETLVYADPPYVHDTRAQDKLKMYAFEMSDADHRALSERLHAFKGLVAISGYASTLYDTLYKDWHRIDMPTEATSGTNSMMADTSYQRMETLWTNYPLVRS